MKILVVYYSRTNTTKKVALTLAEKLDSSIEEVVDKKNRDGVSGWVISGKDAMQKKLADIEECKKRVEDYDLVIIGTPVWVGTMTPAIRTYIADNKDKFKECALFVTQGGNSDYEIFNDIQKLTGKNIIAKMKLTTKEVKSDDYDSKINDFLSKINS
jgi:flavodoxin